MCGLGRFDYSPDPMVEAGRKPFDLTGGHLVSKIYRFGPADRFLETHVAALRNAEAVRVYANLTVRGLDAGPGLRIAGLKATTARGAEVRVRAKHFVLACGAVENARLLLLFQSAAPT